VAIVPASLFCAILLYRMDDAGDLRSVTRAALLLGVLFTAYDLLPFFGTAAVLILLGRRRIRWVAPAIGMMLLPNVLIALTFVAISVPIVNSNTVGYLTVVFSYQHPLRDLRGTVANLAALPLVFVSNFLYSNMVVLPLLFLAAIAIGFRRRLTVLSDGSVDSGQSLAARRVDALPRAERGAAVLRMADAGRLDGAAVPAGVPRVAARDREGVAGPGGKRPRPLAACCCSGRCGERVHCVRAGTAEPDGGVGLSQVLRALAAAVADRQPAAIRAQAARRLQRLARVGRYSQPEYALQQTGVHVPVPAAHGGVRLLSNRPDVW
jgi:hypothetical protein